MMVYLIMFSGGCQSPRLFDGNVASWMQYRQILPPDLSPLLSLPSNNLNYRGVENHLVGGTVFAK